MLFFGRISAKMRFFVRKIFEDFLRKTAFCRIFRMKLLGGKNVFYKIF